MKTFAEWLFAHAPKWNRLAYAGVLLVAFLALVDRVTTFDAPPEAWWLAIGVIVGAWASALTAQEAGKSEVLELAEKMLEREANRDRRSS